MTNNRKTYNIISGVIDVYAVQRYAEKLPKAKMVIETL